MDILNMLKRTGRWIIRGTPIQREYAQIDQINYGEVLKDKKIVITGGGHGIGEKIASKCIAEGASILIIGRNEEKLQNTCNNLGDRSRYLVYDLEDINNLSTLYSKIIEIIGEADSLICNAGISLHEGDMLNVSIEQFEKQMRVNLESSYFLIKEFIKHKDDDELNILCISSERGLQRDDLPYGLTKAALNSLVGGITKRFYKSGVRINAIAPGITTSDLTKKKSSDDITLERVTPGRYILGEEIAEVACFLLSNASRCISGEVIACDAGEYISSYVK